MSERAPYSRVYWSIVDDPKFATIFDDNNHLATWLRLLIVADQSYPASANIPFGVRKASLAALVEAELIDLGTAHRFRVHGLDAERTRRREAATRYPTGTQLGPGPDPEGFGTTGLRRDKTSKDETSRDEEPDDGRADLETFLMLKRRAPSPKQRKLLDEILQRHDQTGPAWAADLMIRHPDDPIGAVLKADGEWRAARIAEAQAQEKPTPKIRRPRSMPESTKELLAHWAASNAKDPAA